VRGEVLAKALMRSDSSATCTSGEPVSLERGGTARESRPFSRWLKPWRDNPNYLS